MTYAANEVRRGTGVGRFDDMSHEMTDAASDPRIGTQIGAYRIDALVAEGSAGRVYKATASDGTHVALKLVKGAQAEDETFQRRFRREARIAQTIDNPYVVRVLENGVHEGTPYLVARFIEGKSLEQKIRREGPLDVRMTVTLCGQIAQGLDAIWASGMVHRDVKPSNILLDNSGTAYLTDFGLAKDTRGTVLTMPRQALGSLDYMAPEQIRGEQLSAATDVYALGCVIFECLQGRPPFADRKGMRVLWAHLQEDPSDPGAGRGDIAPDFARATKLALRKDPAERPGSAVEYARALAKAAGMKLPD